MRGLVSWVAATALLVATATFPWTWFGDSSFSATLEDNGHPGVAWHGDDPQRWLTILALVVAVAMVVRAVPPVVVLVLATIEAVVFGPFGPDPHLAAEVLVIAACTLGAVAAYVPFAVRGPVVVPVLGALVLLAVALAPTVVALDFEPEYQMRAFDLSFAEPWATMLLVAGPAALAITPTRVGDRRNAVVPLVVGVVVTVVALAVGGTEDGGWNGLPFVLVVCAAAAVALVRAPAPV